MRAKSAGKAETILRAMTADDLPAVERIEQTCFSDAWSEKLLSDMLESEVGRGLGACGREEFRDRVCEFPVSRRGRGAYEDRCASGIQGTWGVKETHGSSGNLFKGEGGTGFDSEVRAGNTPAINLYKFYGFQAEAVRKNYYHDPVEDALIMWRRPVPSIPTQNHDFSAIL